ncbi:RNA-dependent RNA polymerase [Podospora fimiseda]|uniref:RNA-directed RNA polymerase n=1 Tax=Podospora fimiseda TaxID=252190 RepID=A0AAN7H4Q5_9PEZI|nr:RNA-dependent RNA polymerase [Podospora fimiseda]
MSANRFVRAAKLLNQHLDGPSAVTGRQRFAIPSLRRSISSAGTHGHHHGPRAASTWTLSGVAGVAMTAGLLGWGISELRHGGFPGTVLFDSSFSTPRYASMREMEQALDEIRQEIADGGGKEDIISTDPDDLHAHGYSEWSTTNPEGLPVAVAYPRSTEQVSMIARICHKYRVPIIPYSGGSSLEGNFSAPFGGISVDFAYMDKIVQFNKDDMDVVVQPSIGWQDLNEQLAKMGSGLFFPIDPGPSAKIGGMIGTNCSGTNAVKYGTMKDWVINLTVVLADGTVIKTRRRPRKSSAGYNLNGIFVGSEGTLGLVTEATLKLTVIPEEFSVAVVTFPSIRDAASAAAEVMQTGIPVAAMEIMDEVQMKVVNMGGATAPRVWKEMPTLFFKFSGTKAGVKENISLVQRITKSNKGSNFEFAKDAREQKLLWSARKESLWSMLALRKEGEEVWSTDVAVPFSRLADIIEVSKKEMDDLGLFASILGHIGDGNFHESIIYNRRDKAERDKVETCVKNMVKRALEMEGTCTGEHSIGWGKKESLLWEVGADTLGVMGSTDEEGRRKGVRSLIHESLSWKQENSVLITLTGIPSNATSMSVKKYFNNFGNVVYVELDEHDKTGLRQAKIRFEPPPYDIGFLEPSGNTVFLDGMRVQAAMVSRIPSDSATIKTPLGKACPRTISFTPERFAFGILTQPITFMSKKELFGAGLNFRADFKRKKLVINFPVKIGRGSKGYRIDIKFAIIKSIHLVNIDKDRTALLMVVNDAPSAWQKTLQSDGSASGDQLVWREMDSWYRAVNITTDEGLTDQKPISLSPDPHIVIDFGQWTSYWIELEMGDKTWSEIETYLLDWNIKTTTGVVFTKVPNRAPELWSILQDQSSSSSGDFSSLGARRHIELPFDVRYQLEVCLSRGILCEHSIDYTFLERLAQLSDPESLDRARGRLVLEYAADQDKRVWDPMELLRDAAALTYYPTTLHIPDYCALVRKVTVTPTRVLFSTPTVETTNRVIRRYKDDQERFLRIQFTDEQSEGRIRGSDADRDDELYTRVFRALSRGIRMGHWHWQFLAFGNSQVRENGAYMFCQPGGPDDTVLTCAKIRAWMGNFKHIQVVAKYAARLGQCFSTTRLLRGLSYPTIVRIPDVEQGRFCFTDGVGKISPGLAKIIADEWKLGATPSAYQFRMGGCKGILVTWNDVKGCEVHVRPSQEKFSAEYNGLEIVRCSQFSAATLNRQTITVLSSLGLANYNAAMEDLGKAVEILRSCADENMTTVTMATMLLDGFMNSNEPFVRTLLQLWRSWSIKALKEKARMVVEQGAFVLGCRTEGASKIARESLPQIFLQVPDPQNRRVYKVITGLCIVGRNPSLHPGDIRVVEAVDIPQLRHLRDVVVFPLRGDRDVPGMCSGGDLDGDDFFVIWDQRLLPSEWAHQPMDYTPPDPVIEKKGASIVDSLASFFVLFMKNDRLPLIAHAHLATADISQDGAREEKCIQLAQLHSVAVDYVKSGVPAKWSKELDPKDWPHFMEKARRSYRSRTALGKLYDMVETQVFDSKENYTLPFDGRILKRFSLTNDMLKEARKIKTQYDIAMRRILGMLEVRTEFEVWTGFVMSKPRVGTDYKVQERVSREWVSLRSQFQEICIKAAGDRDFDKMGPFVAAMYQVTCEEMRIALYEARQPHVLDDGTVGLRRITARSMPLISFPWLFPAELGRIARGSQEQINGPQELLDAGYTKTYDGRFIHRGEILSLFPHGDEMDETEMKFSEPDGMLTDAEQAAGSDGEIAMAVTGSQTPVVAPGKTAEVDLLDFQDEGVIWESGCLLDDITLPGESADSVDAQLITGQCETIGSSKAGGDSGGKRPVPAGDTVPCLIDIDTNVQIPSDIADFRPAPPNGFVSTETVSSLHDFVFRSGHENKTEQGMSEAGIPAAAAQLEVVASSLADQEGSDSEPEYEEVTLGVQDENALQRMARML